MHRGAKQEGGVLIIALIIVAVVSILSGSIFYLLKVKIIQNEAITLDRSIRSFSFLGLRKTKNSLPEYTNTPINGSSNYSSTGFSSTVNYNWKNIYPDSLALYNASASLQYLLSSLATNTLTNRTVTYNAILNLPSQYRLNAWLTPSNTQEVNIPVVKLDNLVASQKNGSDSIDTGQADYIGTIVTDNVNLKLTYTPYPAASPPSYDLNFPSISGPAQTFQLYQGWILQSGAWRLYLFLRSSEKAFYYTNIDLATLLSNPSQFSSLAWNKLILGPGVPAPCPGAREISNNEDILSATPINEHNSIYTLIVLKKTTSDQVTGYTYDTAGCDQASTQSYGALANITSIYSLPIDFDSNQSVSDVLMFMSESSGLKYIHNTDVSAGSLIGDTLLHTYGTIIGTLVYPPQLIPRSSADNFLVIPYADQVEIYLYTKSPVGLSLLHTITGLTGNIVKIIPVNGFIIIITDAAKAYFFSLANGTEFNSYTLASSTDAYITYENVSQETTLHTSIDNLIINSAPMPYGVIGMQQTFN